jgi:stringent starvation protein B
MADAPLTTSTKPYLVRAIYEWCTDNGFTPYVAVFVNGVVRVPMEYVKNREIVLNISFEATQGLKIDNEAITFRARFAGVARELYVPTDNIVAVYARENGQGMAFPLTPELQREQEQGASSNEPSDAAQGGSDKPAGRKTKLSQVKDDAATDTTSNADAATSAKPATKRKAGSAKSAIHAVGPEDMKGSDIASNETSAASADTPDSEPPDPHEPRDPSDPKGKGAGARPTLKRVK